MPLGVTWHEQANSDLIPVPSVAMQVVIDVFASDNQLSEPYVAYGLSARAELDDSRPLQLRLRFIEPVDRGKRLLDA